MANDSSTGRKQRPWERFPIPTHLTLWLLILGIGVAALLNWKVVLGLDLGILIASVVDYTLTFRVKESPRAISLSARRTV
jgi:hypothetical protein